MDATGEEIIERFERNLIPGDAFHHADHVRLAFEYLRRYPVLDALNRFSIALKRFAEARGKTQLYNETITCAYFFLIHERMARCESAEWEEFSARNSELLIWKDGILERYYSKSTLASDFTRKVFVLPDRGGEPDRALDEGSG